MGDDAALIQNAAAQTLLTIDGFRAMLDDPYLFGRIAAHHSLNDIFAMAASPTAALAFITLPLMSEALMEEELFQVLSGVVSVLNDQQVSLVGGHTAEGAEMTVALTITGAPGTTTLTKGSAVVGDRLILTKALGTGVILAATMQGQGMPESFAAALQSMDQSNGPAVTTFIESRAHTLTDITGFGLVGHLSEILRASVVGAELDLRAVPLLPGAEALLPKIQSSLQQANELALADFTIESELGINDARVKALADPQTSGGLLACVPPGEAEACLAQLSAQGYCAADIGCIADSGTWVIR
jgi:selenide,water dikinase